MQKLRALQGASARALAAAEACYANDFGCGLAQLGLRELIVENRSWDAGASLPHLSHRSPRPAPASSDTITRADFLLQLPHFGTKKIALDIVLHHECMSASWAREEGKPQVDPFQTI